MHYTLFNDCLYSMLCYELEVRMLPLPRRFYWSVSVKTTKYVSMKLSGRMRNGPRKTEENFGPGPEKEILI